MEADIRCIVGRAALFLILCVAIAVGTVAFSSCAAVAHTAGLATTEDVRAERDDQRAIDNHLANGAADMHEGKVTPAEFVNDVAGVGAKAVDRTYRRTEPPPPPPINGNSVAEILGGLALAAYTAFAHRSIKQTDAWVAEVEKKTDAKA